MGAPAYTALDEVGQWVGSYGATGHTQQQVILLGNYPVALINQPSAGIPELAYIQPDHLGTPRVVIDPIRDMAIWEWSSKSEVFGNQAPNADPDGEGVAFELALRFPGQQATDASGMFYNYQRNCDPAVGRYSQSDPVGLGAEINTCTCVSGMPTVQVGRFGLESSGSFNNGGHKYSWESGAEVPVISQFANTVDTLRRGANDMVRRNFVGSDKFYHCLAMCEVSSRGPLDASFAATAGVWRELYQQNFKGDSADECAADNRANGQGISAGLRGQSCVSSCASLMPANFTYS